MPSNTRTRAPGGSAMEVDEASRRGNGTVVPSQRSDTHMASQPHIPANRHNHQHQDADRAPRGRTPYGRTNLEPSNRRSIVNDGRPSDRTTVRNGGPAGERDRSRSPDRRRNGGDGRYRDRDDQGGQDQPSQNYPPLSAGGLADPFLEVDIARKKRQAPSGKTPYARLEYAWRGRGLPPTDKARLILHLSKELAKGPLTARDIDAVAFQGRTVAQMKNVAKGFNAILAFASAPVYDAEYGGEEYCTAVSEAIKKVKAGDVLKLGFPKDLGVDEGNVPIDSLDRINSVHGSQSAKLRTCIAKEMIGNMAVLGCLTSFSGSGRTAPKAKVAQLYAQIIHKDAPPPKDPPCIVLRFDGPADLLPKDSYVELATMVPRELKSVRFAWKGNLVFEDMTKLAKHLNLPNNHELYRSAAKGIRADREKRSEKQEDLREQGRKQDKADEQERMARRERMSLEGTRSKG